MANLLSNIPLTREEGFNILRSIRKSGQLALAVLKKEGVDTVIAEGQYAFIGKEDTQLYLVDVSKTHWRFYRSDIIEGHPVCEKTKDEIEKMLLYMVKSKKILENIDISLIPNEEEKEMIENYISEGELSKYDRYLTDNDIRSFLVSMKKMIRINGYHLVQIAKEDQIFEVLQRYFKKEINNLTIVDGNIKISVQKTKIKFGRREMPMKAFCQVVIELARGGELLSDEEKSEYEALVSGNDASDASDASDEVCPCPAALGYADYKDKLEAEEVKAQKTSKNQYFSMMWYSAAKFMKGICENSPRFAEMYSETEKTLVAGLKKICEDLLKNNAKTFSDISLYNEILKYFLPSQKIELNLSIELPDEKIEIDGQSDDRQIEKKIQEKKVKLISVEDLIEDKEAEIKKKTEPNKAESKKEEAQLDLFSLI